MAPTIKYQRLRAPKESGQSLFDPPLTEIGEVLSQNIRLRAAHDFELGGRSLTSLASVARDEMLARAVRYTRNYRDVSVAEAPRFLLLAGHQPELFHPGVWKKNFVLGNLAQQHQAVAVNLLIDSDQAKQFALSVPTGSVERPRLEKILLDQPKPAIAYEERTIEDRPLFTTFSQRVKSAIRPFVKEPLLEQLWPLVCEQMNSQDSPTGEGPLLGLSLAQGRHRLEAAWGLQTLELPQSELCRLEAFEWFAAFMIRHFALLWNAYNSGLHQYRKVHKLRSSAQPLPDLQQQDDWHELPFWIWTREDRSRKRLFVRQVGSEMRISDLATIEQRVELSARDASLEPLADQLRQMADRGVKIRTRALMTTMFARLLLSDLFLHGIGGAKYDQVTDYIAETIFGFSLPRYMTVSATWQLPVAKADRPPHSLQQIHQELRDIEYHPETVLAGREFSNSTEQQQVEQLRQTKQKWVETLKTPENAHQRHLEINKANAALRERLVDLQKDLLAQRAKLESFSRADNILSSREYGFCLYPACFLREKLAVPN